MVNKLEKVRADIVKKEAHIEQFVHVAATQGVEAALEIKLRKMTAKKTVSWGSVTVHELVTLIFFTGLFFKSNIYVMFNSVLQPEPTQMSREAKKEDTMVRLSKKHIVRIADSGVLNQPECFDSEDDSEDFLSIRVWHEPPEGIDLYKQEDTSRPKQAQEASKGSGEVITIDDDSANDGEPIVISSSSSV